MNTVIYKPAEKLFIENDSRMGTCITDGGEGCVFFKGDHTDEGDLSIIGYGYSVISIVDRLWRHKGKDYDMTVKVIEFMGDHLRVEAITNGTKPETLIFTLGK